MRTREMYRRARAIARALTQLAYSAVFHGRAPDDAASDDARAAGNRSVVTAASSH